MPTTLASIQESLNKCYSFYFLLPLRQLGILICGPARVLTTRAEDASLSSRAPGAVPSAVSEGTTTSTPRPRDCCSHCGRAGSLGPGALRAGGREAGARAESRMFSDHSDY